jgi:Tfp pilus assembly protein PilO
MRNFGAWKKSIRVAVMALLALDAALLWFNWQVAGGTSAEQEEQLKPLGALHASWKKDLHHAQDIRNGLADVEKGCSQFFERQFLGEEVGSSTIVADLTAIAAHAGLQTRTVSYKPQELEKRNVIQVDISAAVEGNYASIVNFINGLERSERFYVMESLGLTSAQGGTLKLNLQLRTYFRVKGA